MEAEKAVLKGAIIGFGIIAFFGFIGFLTGYLACKLLEIEINLEKFGSAVLLATILMITVHTALSVGYYYKAKEAEAVRKRRSEMIVESKKRKAVRRLARAVRNMMKNKEL